MTVKLDDGRVICNACARRERHAAAMAARKEIPDAPKHAGLLTWKKHFRRCEHCGEAKRTLHLLGSRWLCWRDFLVFKKAAQEAAAIPKPEQAADGAQPEDRLKTLARIREEMDRLHRELDGLLAA